MLDLSSSVIVVEGKSDVALLSSIIKSNFVTTNGSEVSRETINYLKILSKTYPIIILTDPDGPGRIIRSRLEQELNDVQHIFGVSAESQRTQHKKKGNREQNFRIKRRRYHRSA